MLSALALWLVAAWVLFESINRLRVFATGTSWKSRAR
jgi:hypothetical protein